MNDHRISNFSIIPSCQHQKKIKSRIIEKVDFKNKTIITKSFKTTLVRNLQPFKIYDILNNLSMNFKYKEPNSIY